MQSAERQNTRRDRSQIFGEGIHQTEDLINNAKTPRHDANEFSS